MQPSNSRLSAPRRSTPRRQGARRRRSPECARLTALAIAALGLGAPARADAFCGFFVGGADATLYNNASQVVMVHDEDKTVLTMVNNYKGEPRSFALVVPVPVVLEKDLVRVIELAPVDHLDRFSAPRLVEYFDPDPCAPQFRPMAARAAGGAPSMQSLDMASNLKKAEVVVEAQYTVGEYDIVILSATQSNALETWLRENHYNIPRGAAAALTPYIRSGLKFFVAKVNLEEQRKSGYSTLRPLQFAFPDPRFMLPIRLGMINADGPQDLIVYAITRQFRVEITNYRNPKLPSDQDVPTFVKQDFARFSKDLFSRTLEHDGGKVVFTEHAWNMGWCDPCSTPPLSPAELAKLGVWWLDQNGGGPGVQQAFVTRLHARYTPQTFPEDLMLKVTRDASNFQSRYVLHHPWKPNAGEWCEAATSYVKQLEERRKKEAETLASLTGWDLAEIHRKMEPLPSYQHEQSPQGDDAWKKRMRDLFHGGGW